MIKTRDTKINDRPYSITTLAASDGLEVLGMIARFVGGPLGALISAKGAEGEEEFDLAKLAPALADVGENMASPEFREIVYKLLDGAYGQHPESTAQIQLIKNKSRAGFDAVFSANYEELAPLVRFALEENFGGFFRSLSGPEGTGKLNALIKAGRAKRPKSPQASTGA